VDLPDLSSQIVSFTGHRPDKIGGYDSERQWQVVLFADEILKQTKPRKIISGMAQGWDIAVARSAARLGIPFIAAVPCAGQERLWTPEGKKLYRSVLELAEEVRVISPGAYNERAMDIRNKWMVDFSQHLIALWDGSPGGTSNCVKYATRKNAEIGRTNGITNVWPLWLESRP
jgi:uncharacterized phage-like protein YoqJ